MKKKRMLKIIMVSFVGVLPACSNSKEVEGSGVHAEKFDVIINATTTEAYCGGVSPSEETLEVLKTPNPAPNVILYLRMGDSNDLKKEIDYQFQTNDSGQVETSLPAGTYSIVFENKKDQTAYNELIEKHGKETLYQTAIDTNCLAKHFSQPNGILVVEENGKNTITVNRMMHCQWTRIPCSHYKGDLPPSVSPK